MTAARYCAAPPAALRLCPLDSMVAVYHRASGQTHLVASPVPEIIALLQDEPLTIASLLERLHDRFDVADGDLEGLGARIAELEEAGLVARA